MCWFMDTPTILSFGKNKKNNQSRFSWWLRDCKPGASWALWDTDTNDVTFYRDMYDLRPVIEMFREYDPGIKFLADVMVRE